MPDDFALSANELMRLYLKTPCEDDYARFLDLLIERHALPVIKKSLSVKFQSPANENFYLSAQDFEDLCSESCLSLVEKLSAMRNLPNVFPIRDFNGYAAVVAYNTWNKFLNDGAPNRKSLKNKIRYALGKSAAFEVWREKDEIYGGLTVHKRRLKQISTEDLTVCLSEEFADFRNAALPDLLYEILEKADSALKVNEIVLIVATLWAVEDKPDVSLEVLPENSFGARKKWLDKSEMQFELEQIWQEIQLLPVNQRTALLYNLRDEKGREMLFMFFNAQIASLKNIAEAMNLSVGECVKILPLLPFDDKTIAVKMNLTEKQIGNLRKAARDNLRRRLAGKPKLRSPIKKTDAQNEERKNGKDFDGIPGEVLS